MTTALLALLRAVPDKPAQLTAVSCQGAVVCQLESARQRVSRLCHVCWQQGSNPGLPETSYLNSTVETSLLSVQARARSNVFLIVHVGHRPRSC